MSQTKMKGFFDWKEWSVIGISGPDAQDFLNRLSTLNFKHWDTARTRLGAFLTGKSAVVSLGYFQSTGMGYHYIVAPPQKDTVLEHLERLHFAENLEIRDESLDWALFGIIGADVPEVEALGGLQWKDPLIPALSVVKIPKAHGPEFIQTLKTRQIAPLPDAQFEELRVRHGVPRPGRELDGSVLVLEAGLEGAVDRNKGCYPGQEVVERIFTYGRVNRRLLPVEVSGQWRQAKLPLVLSKAGRPVATLVTALESQGTGCGLAFVHRDWWDRSEPLEDQGVGLRILRPQEA